MNPMKPALLLCALLTAAPLVLSQEPEKPDEREPWKVEFDAAYDKAVDELERRYPDVLNDTSIFTQELDRRYTDAKAKGELRRDNPDLILVLADQLAVDLRRANIPFQVVTELKPSDQVADNFTSEDTNQEPAADGSKTLQKMIPDDPSEGVTIDLARAHTLARSSNNPVAQRIGARMLAQAERQRMAYRLRKQADSGIISWESAEAQIAKLEANAALEQLRDEQADTQFQMEEQLRKRRHQMQADMERQRFEMEQQQYHEQMRQEFGR